MKLNEVKTTVGSLLVEMAGRRPDQTGLGVNIWVAGSPAQHGPRIKVCNIIGTFSNNPRDNFSISVSKDPQVVEGTPDPSTIKAKQLARIKYWIILNYDDLMLIDQQYKVGQDPTPIIDRLKKV